MTMMMQVKSEVNPSSDDKVWGHFHASINPLCVVILYYLPPPKTPRFLLLN